MDLESMNIGSLCDTYLEVLSSLDKVRSEEKKLNGRKAELAAEVLRRCDSEGIDKLNGTGITLSVREKPVVKVDGDWNEILKELVASDHGFLVQRRVTAGKLQEEMDAGLRMPEGLSVEMVREVSHRRG